MSKVLSVLMHSAPYRDPVVNDFLLKKKQYEIDIVYLYGDGVLCHPEWDIKHKNFEVIPHRKITVLNKSFDCHYGLLKRIKNYDVIFINGYFPIVNLFLLMKCKLLHKKIIFSCDTIYFKHDLLHKFIYRYVKHSSSFFVPGKRTKNALIRDLGIDESRIFCGSYLCDSKEWEHKVSKFSQHNESKKFKLLFVGKLREIRNIPLLMNVVAEAIKIDNDVELTFVGNGNCYKNELCTQIERGGCGIFQKFHLMGLLNFMPKPIAIFIQEKNRIHWLFHKQPLQEYQLYPQIW